MRFSHKFGKVISGEAFESAKRHTRAFLRNRRFPARLTTAAIIASIDSTAFEEIRKKYAVEDPGDAPPKYLDLETWMQINLQRVRELELDYAPPSNILDIGCGAGYFLYISKILGHNVLGLDMDDMPMFRELTELLRIPRVIARVQAFQALPDLDRKFDVWFRQHRLQIRFAGDQNVWDLQFNRSQAADAVLQGGEIACDVNI